MSTVTLPEVASDKIFLFMSINSDMSRASFFSTTMFRSHLFSSSSCTIFVSRDCTRSWSSLAVRSICCSLSFFLTLNRAEAAVLRRLLSSSAENEPSDGVNSSGLGITAIDLTGSFLVIPPEIDPALRLRLELGGGTGTVASLVAGMVSFILGAGVWTTGVDKFESGVVPKDEETDGDEFEDELEVEGEGAMVTGV